MEPIPELRQRASSNRAFGLVMAVAVVVLPVGAWSWRRVLVGLAVGLLALVAPTVFVWPNRLWTWLGAWLHRLTHPVVMAVIFYGVFVPLGVLMRLFGRDALRLRIDKGAETYWVRREGATSMKEQF